MSEDEIINILIKHGHDAEKYRKKHKKRKYTPRPKKYDEKIIRELYDEGKGDLEISQIIGCTRQIVYYWRLKNELPSNGRKKRSPNKKAAQLEL